jgi:hypothetical protein
LDEVGTFIAQCIFGFLKGGPRVLNLCLGISKVTKQISVVRQGSGKSLEVLCKNLANR